MNAIPIHELRPGDAIGPYELLYPAARGGFATVWAARRRGSRGFGQVVALKLLSSTLRGDRDAKAMFVDEARTASGVMHPNVGQVIDFSEDRGVMFLAMEWIDGESLASIFAARRASGTRLPVTWVLHVAAAACAGLHAAHELRDEDGQLLQVVHRDVSPQNVMVTWSGFVKVVDFGIAKSRRRTHVTRVLGTIKGKVGYFSPEQIAGHEIDRRSDLFSFGILLYLLVTNVHPFRKADDGQTIASIARGAPRPPRVLVPDLSPALEAILERALAKDPAQRFQSADELQRAIEDVIVETRSAISARQVGQVVRDLFPGVEEERAAQLSHAIKIADEARVSLPDGVLAAAPAAVAPGDVDPTPLLTLESLAGTGGGEMTAAPLVDGSSTPVIPMVRVDRRLGAALAAAGALALALGAVLTPGMPEGPAEPPALPPAPGTTSAASRPTAPRDEPPVAPLVAASATASARAGATAGAVPASAPARVGPPYPARAPTAPGRPAAPPRPPQPKDAPFRPKGI